MATKRILQMKVTSFRRRAVGTGVVLAGALALWTATSTGAEPDKTASAAAPPAVPVSVAVVERRNVATWDEFSGRLEAVGRVEVRSRVAGALQAVHFREGALVRQGDPLITIDPAPYAAEVDRAAAQVAAAEAGLKLAKSGLDRGQQLWNSHTISQSDLDTRANAAAEADANLRAASASLQAARLNFDYTEIRAPIDGRVGALGITVGNLVAAGPGAPVLTTLVSVDPIYASFSADEQVVTRALDALGADGDATHLDLERIPVQMLTATSNGTPFQGHLQLIDNQFDAASGTVHLRAVFDNPRGRLIPGQFARLRLGQANAEPALLVSDRAIGTDQDKKFVMVVDGGNKAVYREVKLGTWVEGLRVVTNGLNPGEHIIVNGLQRIRPGGIVRPEVVPMVVGLAAAAPASAVADAVQR
jgi:multidrug efflux system membrane fusion protein